MPLYKFGAGDVFYNQLRTYPSSSFYIYSGSVYYQNKSTESGSHVANVNGVPVGNVSLFELNVDRVATTTGRFIGPEDPDGISSRNVIDNGTIYPFVPKGSQKVAFKGLTRNQFLHDYADKDIITGSYMMSASLVRKSYGTNAGFNDTNVDGAALRNSLDYAKRLGEHYNFASGASVGTTLIDIPSVFYGSQIKKGTVNLKFYITGTLIAHCRDSRYDGALIMNGNSANGALTDGTEVGVVLYNEGLIILTSSTALETLNTNVRFYNNRSQN